MALLSGIPTSLYNSWNKLARYQHHSNFLFRCVKKNRIPPGLQLSLNLQLDKDNHSLQESCKQHLQAASFAILKSLSTATWQKTKTLQNQLQLERENPTGKSIL